jgi:hypothetical protein
MKTLYYTYKIYMSALNLVLYNNLISHFHMGIQSLKKVLVQ